MKYRVLKVGKSYYPQYRFLGVYNNMSDPNDRHFPLMDYMIPVYFGTEKEAREFIEKDIIKSKESKGKVVATLNSKKTSECWRSNE